MKKGNFSKKNRKINKNTRILKTLSCAVISYLLVENKIMDEIVLTN